MQNTHDKLKLLQDNNVKVYPMPPTKDMIKLRDFKQAVCIEDRNNLIYKEKMTIGVYKHTTDTINKALEDAVDYIVSKLN